MKRHSGFKMAFMTAVGLLIPAASYNMADTPAQSGAKAAYRVHWTDEQFLRDGTWAGNEDSTGTIQFVPYTCLMRASSADTTAFPLYDAALLLARADFPPLSALQRRAIRDNNGAFVEATGDSASAYGQVNSFISSHIGGTGVPPAEPQYRTWGGVKRSFGDKTPRRAEEDSTECRTGK